MSKEIISTENIEAAERLTSWLIASFGALGTALIGGIAVWIKRVFRSRAEKKVETADARVADVNADKAELSLWEEERRTLKESKDFWLLEWKRVDKALFEYRKTNEEKFEAYKQESEKQYSEIKDELARMRAIYEAEIANHTLTKVDRDKYKSLLSRLIEAIIFCNCKDIDLTDYENALK